MKKLICTLLVCFVMALGVVSTGLAQGKAATAQVALIPVNSAGVKKLQQLPGVGAVIAQRIVAYRTAHGPFKKVDGLLKVKGIGKKTFQRIKPKVTL